MPARALLRRVWHWVAPAVLGTLLLATASSLGNGGIDRPTLMAAAVLGSLMGYTARSVKLLRARLGTATTWLAAALVWGVLVFGALRALPVCPVELHGERCSTQESSLWSVNAALVILVLALMIEPPRALRRKWRGRKRRKR